MPATRKTPGSPTPGSPTADFLARACRASDLTQSEIARKAGFVRPNMISMMKLGTTKVPLERIPDLAEACGVDPAHFMRIALREYQPDLLELVENHVGDLLTLNEIRLVDCYRAVTKEDDDLDLDAEVRLAVTLMLERLRDRRKRRRK